MAIPKSKGFRVQWVKKISCAKIGWVLKIVVSDVARGKSFLRWVNR